MAVKGEGWWVVGGWKEGTGQGRDQAAWGDQLIRPMLKYRVCLVPTCRYVHHP